jgi:hypothetical protein
MGAILDIVLSLVIRGAIAIAIMNMTVALQGKLSEKTAQANMFNLTTTVSRIMSNDFTRIGYAPPGISLTLPYFTYISKDTIEVTYYEPSSATQKWVKYFAGDTTELSTTSNRRDRKLYRAKGASGSAASAIATGVDSLRFTYFDVNGDTAKTNAAVKSFSVYLVMATGEEVNGIYPASEWTYRFFPSSIN